MTTWVRPVLYTVAILAFLALAGYAYILNQRYKADSVKWRHQAEQRYREGRSEASEILRTAVDQIADDKIRLSGMSERELILEAVMGLAGLGRRMDRIEDSMRAFSQFESLLDSINGQTEEIAKNAELLSGQVARAQDSAAAFCASVSDTGEAVYSLSDASHNVQQLLETVSAQIDTLGGISNAFSGLQSQMQDAVVHINQLLRISMDNPAAVLGQMDSRISAVHDQLQNMSEGLNLMAESLEGMQDTLGAVSERVRKTDGVS